MRRVIVVAGMLVAGLLPAAPAAAETCQPSNGVAIPAAQPAQGDFSFTGGGWGHGAGMSQYGARGGARSGCSFVDILTTYYPGVSVEDAPEVPDNLRVSLFPDRPGGSTVQRIRVGTHDGSVPWHNAADGALIGHQPQGRFWRIEVDAAGFRIHDEAEGDHVVWQGGGPTAVVRVPFDGTIVQLSSKSTNLQWGEGRPYRHGTLEFAAENSGMYVTLAIHAKEEASALEWYLRGLAEMPSSWELEALKAQAVAGRSYALDRWETFRGNRTGCRCDLYDTVWDQVYNGFLKESEGNDAQFGRRWVEAVGGSANKVMRHEGATAVGYYSSSHGGHSESSRFAFGGPAIDYLRPVDDTNWDSQSDNPFRTWTQSFSGQDLGQRLGVGTALRVTLLEPKGAAGRVGRPDLGYGGVRVEGTAGTRYFSGDQVRSLLGLRSTLFEVHANVEPSPCDPTNDQSGNRTVTRIAGPQRIDTAVAVSSSNWQTSEHVLLATAGDFPDALAAGSLAAKLDAPLLLTPADRLPQSVADELGRMQAKTVWLMGGTAATSPAVEEQLRAAGYDVRRLAGATRVDTAKAIALAPEPAPTGEVVVALGQNWPDAVAAGALSASPARMPILLTGTDDLPATTEQTLAELEAKTVFVVGGTAVVSDAVVRRLQELGYEVRRLSGQSRWGTSAAVAAEARARAGADRQPMVFASGEQFPDALTAGALVARLGGNLKLVPRCNLDGTQATRDFLTENSQRLDGGPIVGGTAAVSDRTREQLTELLTG